MVRDEYLIHVDVDSIVIGERRDVNQEVVRRIRQSIEEIGLQHPITVRKAGDETILVAGRHRLEAVRASGANTIQAHVVRWTKDRARMWEISENLHRAELSMLERAEQIEEWRQLKAAEGAKVLHPSKALQPHNRGVSETAHDLGIARSEVQNAEKLASLSDEAKAEARALGLDDKQSVLLRVAQAPENEQAQAVRDIAEARASKTEQAIKNQAAQDLAELFATHIPADAWDMLKASIKTADSIHLILAAFNNLVGTSIMDRRHG